MGRHLATGTQLRWRRGVRIFAVPLLLICGLVITQAGIAQAAPGDFGAIAYSPSTQVSSFGSGGSAADAEGASVAGCQSQGGSDCVPYIWVENGFASLARGGNVVAAHWGFTVSGAQQRALRDCQANGGTDCAIVLDIRTSDTPDSSPSAQGRVLIAPGGQPNGCSRVFTRGTFFDFSEPCRQHDLCYMNNGGTNASGGAKDECDDAFLQDMLTSCDQRPPPDRIDCAGLARAYYNGVRIFGEPYFRDPDRADRAGPRSRGDADAFWSNVLRGDLPPG
jgi:hypothetical protein